VVYSPESGGKKPKVRVESINSRDNKGDRDEGVPENDGEEDSIPEINNSVLLRCLDNEECVVEEGGEFIGEECNFGDLNNELHDFIPFNQQP
jgi:hypothetical protein